MSHACCCLHACRCWLKPLSKVIVGSRSIDILGSGYLWVKNGTLSVRDLETLGRLKRIELNLEDFGELNKEEATIQQEQAQKDANPFDGLDEVPVVTAAPQALLSNNKKHPKLPNHPSLAQVRFNILFTSVSY